MIATGKTGARRPKTKEIPAEKATWLLRDTGNAAADAEEHRFRVKEGHNGAAALRRSDELT